MSEERHVEYLALVGKWAEIRTAGSIGTGETGYNVGKVLQVDDGFLILQDPRGSRLFLPANSIRSVRVMEIEPQGEAGLLLRPAEAPDDSPNLLRPAGSGVDEDTTTLLRPAAEKS